MFSSSPQAWHKISFHPKLLKKVMLMVKSNGKCFKQKLLTELKPGQRLNHSSSGLVAHPHSIGRFTPPTAGAVFAKAVESVVWKKGLAGGLQLSLTSVPGESPRDYPNAAPQSRGQVITSRIGIMGSKMCWSDR